MRKLLGVALVACLVVTVGAADKKEEKDPLAGVKCPISGKPVVAKGVAEHNGGKVYFCCTNCPKAFAANTAKYATKANHQLALTGQAKQACCPIKFKPVNAQHNVSVSGVEVGVCCPGCKKKVGSAEGNAQLELVFKDAAFKKAFKVGKDKKK